MNLASIVGPHPADSVALVQGSRRVSYGQLRAYAARARAGLAAHGVGQGDRVGLLCTSSPEFVVAYLAVVGLGAAAVPVNPQSPISELEQQLAAVRPAAVIVGPSEGGPGGWLEDRAHRIVEAVEIMRAKSVEAPVVDLNANAPAALLFTSGTAGLPRAATLTHGSLLANIEQTVLRVGNTPEDVALLLLPPFHVFGLNAVVGPQLFVGGATVMAERFDSASTLALAKAERVTLLPGVPEVFASLAADETAQGDDLATVRLAVSGAAPLSAEVAARFNERFGIRVWQGYGLTEASATVTFPDLAGPYDAASVGTPLPGVEVRIIDPDGEEVIVSDPGEIIVRGPNVFAGYFEDPEATERVLDPAGWLHTGDVAVMSEDGVLTIVDRYKDLIIVSGFNVFPEEVEDVLARHPDVAEAAVVGVPDPVHGESVRAFVVPRSGLWPEQSDVPEQLDESAIVRHCARYLARYKCPGSVSFVRKLPRSVHGKALRRELR